MQEQYQDDGARGQEETLSSADKENQDPQLPEFLTHPTRVDRWLLLALVLMGVYSLAMIPLRAYLLVHHPLLYMVLTGSGLSVLVTGAQNPEAYGLWTLCVLVAAASHVKFMAVYFLMGKQWGQDFIDWMFASHTPLWYRKLEGFVHRHLYLCLFLAFLPFSPIPATILVALAGIRKVKGWLLAAYVYLLAVALKCFMLYLGVTFGEGIQPTLQTIDRYMTQISIVLLVYMFVVIWWKNSRGEKQKK